MNQDQRYALAKEQARKLRGFYSHLATYVVLNIVLAIVNLVVSPGDLWFYWITIFWGIGLVFHALDVFTIQGRFLGSEWEERKAKEIMDKRERKAG